MSRPVSKEELIVSAELNFSELFDFINGLPENIKSKTYKNNELNDRDKTIADVICHLHEWHLMRENWYKEGMSGKKTTLKYSLQTLPIINHNIWEKYKGTELKKAMTIFEKSHKAVMALIEKHNDEELFSKKKYEFTGSTTLGAYFYYNTADHYKWALKTIKPLKKMVE
jgi:hypothetical protein